MKFKSEPVHQIPYYLYAVAVCDPSSAVSTATARLISAVCLCQNITSTLRDTLHCDWLLVVQRIYYKVAMMTFDCSMSHVLHTALTFAVQ